MSLQDSPDLRPSWLKNSTINLKDERISTDVKASVWRDLDGCWCPCDVWMQSLRGQPDSDGVVTGLPQWRWIYFHQVVLQKWVHLHGLFITVRLVYLHGMGWDGKPKDVLSPVLPLHMGFA